MRGRAVASRRLGLTSVSGFEFPRFDGGQFDVRFTRRVLRRFRFARQDGRKGSCRFRTTCCRTFRLSYPFVANGSLAGDRREQELDPVLGLEHANDRRT